jgi:hypothetical protein
MHSTERSLIYFSPAFYTRESQRSLPLRLTKKMADLNIPHTKPALAMFSPLRYLPRGIPLSLPHHWDHWPTVVKDKAGEGVSYCITPQPYTEQAELLWAHCGNAEDDTYGALRRWSALKKDHARRIQGHADPKLPPPDTLGKIDKCSKWRESHVGSCLGMGERSQYRQRATISDLIAMKRETL